MNETLEEIIEVPSQISVESNIYPDRVKAVMGNKAPQSLDLVGNTSLLNKVSIGICGSRNASELSLRVAKDCAIQAAQSGIVVVSGNAKGIDLEAHYNALKAGGDTLLVLPEGIDNFRVRKELQPVWNWANVLVISQFPANTNWRFYNAMARNMLIVALSGALVVVQAGEKGGTLDAGIKAIRNNVPLYAVQYKDMEIARGNQILFDRKEQVGRIRKCSRTNKANLKDVFTNAENVDRLPQLI